MGKGKSFCKFFVSDDKNLVIKTVKQIEMNLLMNGKLLEAYLDYITQHESSLIIPILGLYEVEGTVFVLLPYVGNCNPIVRCFDIKGSLYGRNTKVPTQDLL